MWRTFTALTLAITLPGNVSAGPLKDAAEKAGREAGRTQQEQASRSRTGFWTGVALLAGGGVMAALGSVELGDDDDIGPDDGEDLDDSDDGEDSDGWGNKALVGGGIAAATIGGVLLITGRRSGLSISVRPRGAAVRQTVRF